MTAERGIIYTSFESATGLMMSQGNRVRGGWPGMATPPFFVNLARAVSRALAVALVALTIPHCPAVANDTAAAFAAGGLVFQRSDAVRMVSEVLRISPERIDVDYVFENTSQADVTTVVAFPLPTLDMADLFYSPNLLPSAIGGSPLGAHQSRTQASPNFLNFRVLVDGAEITPDVEVRSFLRDGREITASLRELEVDPIIGEWKDRPHPRKRHKQTADNTTAPKSMATTEALIDLGAAERHDDFAFGLWSTKVTFHWPQTFPAGKRIRVQHTYQPAPGGSLVSPSQADEWCADQGFLHAFKKLPRYYEAQGFDSSYLDGRWVKYILTTGANWSGPIGHFTLEIDKADADLVSTCPIPGLKLVKKGNSFTATATDYLPTSDLNILFARGRCPAGTQCR